MNFFTYSRTDFLAPDILRYFGVVLTQPVGPFQAGQRFDHAVLNAGGVLTLHRDDADAFGTSFKVDLVVREQFEVPAG